MVESEQLNRRELLNTIARRTKIAGAGITVVGLGVLAHSGERANSLMTSPSSDQTADSQTASDASLDTEINRGVTITLAGIAITTGASLVEEPLENLRISRRELLQAKEGLTAIRTLFQRSSIESH